MALEQIAALQIEVSAADTPDEDIDRMTRQLLSELQGLDVESAELAHGAPAPAGAKIADPVTLGTIAVTLLPAVLPKVIDFAQAWATRGAGRTIKFKGKIGKDEIEFEGPPDELKKILAGLKGDQRK